MSAYSNLTLYSAGYRSTGPQSKELVRDQRRLRYRRVESHSLSSSVVYLPRVTDSQAVNLAWMTVLGPFPAERRREVSCCLQGLGHYFTK